MAEEPNIADPDAPKEGEEPKPDDEAILGATGDMGQSFGPVDGGDELAVGEVPVDGGPFGGPDTSTLITGVADPDQPLIAATGMESSLPGGGESGALPTGMGDEGPFATAVGREPSAAHLPSIHSNGHPEPVKVPDSDGVTKNTSPSRLPQVKSIKSNADEGYAAARARAKAAREAREKQKDISKSWNPHVARPVDTSLALKKPVESSAGKIREQKSSSSVSSPTRAERNKRKAWAEAAAKRQAEAARRLLDNEAKNKAEAEARMEARKAAVRARIEQEKEAQARLAAKRQAVMKGDGEQTGTISQDEGKHAMRKRSGSPRPLYVRLAEDYERRQQQEEEETRKKLEMQAAIRQVRVQALMNGEVIIRPLPDVVKPTHESPPRWNPAGRGPPSPGRDKMLRSPHRSGGNSVAGDTLQDIDYAATSPTARSHAMQKEANGVVLYSMQDGEESGGEHSSPLIAGGNRHGKLVTRREREGANNQQRFNNPRRLPMVDRACSPFVVDPATQQPTNVPAQDLFWQNKAAPERPSAAASTGQRRLGALEQEPPPPPASRFSNNNAKGAKQVHQSQDAELPTVQQLEDAGVDLAAEQGAPQGDIDLGESFAEELPAPEPAPEPSAGGEEGAPQGEEEPLEVGAPTGTGAEGEQPPEGEEPVEEKGEEAAAAPADGEEAAPADAPPAEGGDAPAA